MQLILGALGASKTRAVETHDAFEVCKQHLDLLPGIAQDDIGVGDVAGALPRCFLPRSCDLSSGLTAHASGLQRAGSAILLPDEVLLEALLAKMMADAR